VLTTNCPSCSTAFRVTPEQLKARAGKVRCGHCQAVFNALESLNDLPPAPPETHEAVTDGPLPQPAPEEPAGDRVAEAGPTADLAGTAVVAKPDDPLLANAGKAPTPVRRGLLIVWSLAVVAALGLVTLQAAYLLRADLAVGQPELRPLLDEMCGLLECDIPLPRRADQVSIEASALHPDPQRKMMLVLVATLKNRAPFAQDYPHLELTLTDTQDQPIVRKVLAPADYLAEGSDIRAGFAANGEQAVSLWLDAGELGASGYRLYLFYP
jgi:predicted Zn finger-like uncharacterized protein